MVGQRHRPVTTDVRPANQLYGRQGAIAEERVGVEIVHLSAPIRADRRGFFRRTKYRIQQVL